MRGKRRQRGGQLFVRVILADWVPGCCRLKRIHNEQRGMCEQWFTLLGPKKKKIGCTKMLPCHLARQKYLGAIKWAVLRGGVSKRMFLASFQVKSRHVVECDPGDITKCESD